MSRGSSAAGPAPARARLPRTARLRKRSEFGRVQRFGRRHAGSVLVVIVADNDLGRPRLGLAVSRKVGGAVVRNRVKRWVREVFRRASAGVGGKDIVVIARPAAAQAGYLGVAEEIGRVLLRVAQEKR